MAYLDEDKLKAYLPENFLTEALDDDEDEDADTGLLAGIIAAAGDEVDGILGQRYTTPFDPVPSIVRNAAVLFALEIFYLRRGMSGEQNPYESRAIEMRKKLGRIATGAEPLLPTIEPTRPSGSVISEPSGTFSPGNRIIL